MRLRWRNESYTRAFRILRRIGRHNPNELTAVLIYTPSAIAPFRDATPRTKWRTTSAAGSIQLSFATPAD
jgi:hypothetical protein